MVLLSFSLENKYRADTQIVDLILEFFFNDSSNNFIVHVLSFRCICSIKLNRNLSAMKRWPIELPNVCRRKLNLCHVGTGCSLTQPVGIGFVIAKPCWLFSSIFEILVIIRVYREKNPNCLFLFYKLVLDHLSCRL